MSHLKSQSVNKYLRSIIQAGIWTHYTVASLVLVKGNLDKSSAIIKTKTREACIIKPKRNNWWSQQERQSELSEHMMSVDDDNASLPIDIILSPPMLVPTQLRFLNADIISAECIISAEYIISWMYHFFNV